MKTLEERFWSKVRKSRGCWLWKGAHTQHGYGLLGTTGGPNVLTHRFAYELLIGPIPPGLWVLHKCDRPACCRPDHLFLGRQGENMADASRKGRLLTGVRWAQAHLASVPRGNNHPLRRHPELIPRGEQRAHAKLHATDVRRIRKSAARVSQRQLAQRYGVAQQTISKIVTRQKWRHV